MKKTLDKLILGYSKFRNKYANHKNSLMKKLHYNGQEPKIMVVSCCDSRVDPALLLQCDPGDIFTLRNIANLIPPYEEASHYNETCAALEFGLKVLDIKNLIILGHSECGGIKTWINSKEDLKNEKNTYFINEWLSVIDIPNYQEYSVDECAKISLKQSYNNCLTFPWIKEKIKNNDLLIHLWFFDIKNAQILTYNHENNEYSKFAA